MVDKSHGGDIWRHLKSSKCAILDFSVNISPLGMPQRIKGYVLSNIDKLNYYPQPQSLHLKNRLAKFHGLSGNNILVGNGAIELIHLLPRALKARVVLIPVPTFSEYEFAAKANNASCIFIETSEKNNFKVDVLKLIKLLAKTDLVFLCNPNNPTGCRLSSQEVILLLKACKERKVTLVIDEVFMDFVFKGDENSMISESARNKCLLVIRSLTKFFVLPGLRVGYLTGHKDVLERISQSMFPWNVNTLAQVISAKVIEDSRYISKAKSIIAEERPYLYNSLSSLKGIKAYPSDANFFLCRLKAGRIKNAEELSAILIRKGILIRNCRNFRGLNGSFFRIAVRKREDNIRLISTLRQVLG